MRNLQMIILKQKIYFKKVFLNLLLKKYCPTNKLIVIISQDLDKDIVLYQKEI